MTEPTTRAKQDETKGTVDHNLACGDSWWKGEACYHGTPPPDSMARFHEQTLRTAIAKATR